MAAHSLHKTLGDIILNVRSVTKMASFVFLPIDMNLIFPLSGSFSQIGAGQLFRLTRSH